MNKDIKFSSLLGVQREQNSEQMQLPFADHVLNHVGNMHASAQFALAEISSGDYMRKRFPELADKVMAVVRRAEIKYSKPVDCLLTACPSADDGEAKKMLDQLERKGKALFSVQVKLKNETGEITTHAVYHWFVTKL